MNSGCLGFGNSLLAALRLLSEDSILSLHVVFLSDFFFLIFFFFNCGSQASMTALRWRDNLAFFTIKYCFLLKILQFSTDTWFRKD